MNGPRTFVLIITIALAAEALAPLKGQAVESGKAAPGLMTRNPRYQLRPSDVVEIGFAPAGEFNQTVTIQPDGYVSLREVGDLFVQGKTVPELSAAVKQAYAGILHNAVITVTLREFVRPHFTADGQVSKPGRYELRSDTTVSEALAIAGGFTDKAKQRQVLIFRRVSDDWVEVKQLDIKALYQGHLREDVHLRPGDLVFVPRSRLASLKPFLPVWSLGTYLGVNPQF